MTHLARNRACTWWLKAARMHLALPASYTARDIALYVDRKSTRPASTAATCRTSLYATDIMLHRAFSPVIEVSVISGGMSYLSRYHAAMVSLRASSTSTLPACILTWPADCVKVSRRIATHFAALPSRCRAAHAARRDKVMLRACAGAALATAS